MDIKHPESPCVKMEIVGRRPKDRDIVCSVCGKRMRIGHGLTSVLKDYSQCAKCLEEEDGKDKKNS